MDDLKFDMESMITPIYFNTSYLNDRLSRIKKPLVHDSLELPKSRSIHVNMFNNVDEDNYQSLSILNEIERDRLLVQNIHLLHNPIGKFRFKKKNFSQYDMGLKRVFKRTRTIRDGDKINVTNRDLLAFNYKLTFQSYIYTHHRLTKWYQFRNQLETLVATINDKAVMQHNVILFDLPVDIPKINIMNRLMLKEYSPMHLKAFPTNDSKLMFEFWKIFFKDANSIFDGIDADKRDSIFIAFRNEGKYTIYKLRDIYALSKDNEMEDRGKIGAKGNREAAKLFIYTLSQFKLFTTVDKDMLKSMMKEEDDEYDDVDDLLSNIGIETEESDDDVLDELDEDEVLDVKDIPVDENVMSVNVIADNPVDNQRVLLDNIEKAGKDKLITKAENSRLSETVDKQLDNEFIINGKKTKLKEILDYSNIDKSVRTVPMKGSEVVLDKELLDDTNNEVDRKYVKEVYRKDLFNSIYGIQKGGVVITEHTIEENKSFLGESETHILTIKPLKGKPSTVKLILPKINEDGTYSMSSHNYMLRKQRKD